MMYTIPYDLIPLDQHVHTAFLKLIKPLRIYRLLDLLYIDTVARYLSCLLNQLTHNEFNWRDSFDDMNRTKNIPKIYSQKATDL